MVNSEQCCKYSPCMYLNTFCIKSFGLLLIPLPEINPETLEVISRYSETVPATPAEHSYLFLSPVESEENLLDFIPHVYYYSNASWITTGIE